jgi:hypothetical protein
MWAESSGILDFRIRRKSSESSELKGIDRKLITRSGWLLGAKVNDLTTCFYKFRFLYGTTGF